ncbi:MAG: type II toxin-antitoxin system HicA family toxin [Verrucomicrobiota bacterium]
MKQVKPKQFIAAIEKRGWALARIKGSHHIYVKTGHRERIVLPVHGNRPLKLGLLKAQMKIAGLSEDDV